MEQFAIRFVIACCAVFLGEKLLEALNLNPRSSEIFNFILIAAAVIFVIFGGFLVIKI